MDNDIKKPSHPFQDPPPRPSILGKLPDTRKNNNVWIFAGIISIIAIIVFITYLKQSSSDSKSLDSESTIGNNNNYTSPSNTQPNVQSNNTNSQNTRTGETYNKNDPPAEKIATWINYLGNKDFRSAHNLMNKKKYGTYEKFSSIKGYGGITSTKLFSCVTAVSNNCSYEVIADYESIDPYNKSGRFKQRFYISNCSGYWEISKIENIEINFY